MPTIDISDDISIYHSDPMHQTVTVLHTSGDVYDNDTSCGQKLTALHKTLQRLDFPYAFVKIITTNTNIANELETLRCLYSTEQNIIKYELQSGEFNRTVYSGDTYCVLPWIHKYVNPQGLVLPCCRADENYPLGNINNSKLHNISTKTIRQQMLDGQRPDACSSCYTKEDAGLTSPRQNANKDFEHYRSQQNFVQRSLDIRLSNKCNLMCRMCSGKFSNRISQEEEKLYGFSKYKDETLSNDVVQEQLDYIEDNIQTIEKVYFAGGEPLINKEHYDILNLLIKHNKTNVEIFYNTNFSLLNYKNYDIIKMWSNFDKINIGASIDLIGKQSNYVRHGVEYSIIEQNYDLIKNLTNIDFQVCSIVHLMNVFNLPKLQRHWLDIGLKCNKFNLNTLINPAEQSLRVLPNYYKKLACIEIDNHVNHLQHIKDSKKLIKQWMQAKDYMTSKDDSNLLSEFFRLNDDKDHNRKQRFEDYYPEYKDLRKYA